MPPQFHVRAGEDEFDVQAADSILSGALRAGVWLPHSCTQGTCGSCKLKVCSGEVDHADSPEYTLSDEERAFGLALTCRAHALSDLVLERPTDAAAPAVVFPLRDLTAAVVALDDIARDTRRLVVALDGEPLRFHPGQYAELVVPGEHAVVRPYSIASPPSHGDALEFHIKRVPGGAATDNWIFAALAVGDPVSLRGPLGQFVLDGPQPEAAILIGGGTGLAPLKSMVRQALADDLLPEIYLYHGGRTESDLYDQEFFADVERAHPRFHYRPVLSEQQWAGTMGMVTDAVADDFASCRGMRAYLCGPPRMIDAGVRALKRRRMAPRLIRREEFTPSV